MSKIERFVTTPRGERVKVTTLNAEMLPKKARKEKFAAVDLKWLASTAEAAGCPCATVLVVMQYLAWESKSKTFAFSNTLLNQLGVTRWVKYRVLSDLEAAGAVRIERRGWHAPLVTLL